MNDSCLGRFVSSEVAPSGGYKFFGFFSSSPFSSVISLQQQPSAGGLVYFWHVVEMYGFPFNWTNFFYLSMKFKLPKNVYT